VQFLFLLILLLHSLLRGRRTTQWVADVEQIGPVAEVDEQKSYLFLILLDQTN
jgi:hypothetical protein